VTTNPPGTLEKKTFLGFLWTLSLALSVFQSWIFVPEKIFETDNFRGFHLRGIERGVQMPESSPQALGRNLAMLH
jgi:hypothetical protein